MFPVYLSALFGSAEICRPSQQLANSWRICRELAPEQLHIRSYEPTGKRLTELAKESPSFRISINFSGRPKRWNGRNSRHRKNDSSSNG
jgi:hypothetical protein